MTNYVCGNCKFRLESDKLIKRCPYCDSNSLTKEKNAEELLDSIEAE